MGETLNWWIFIVIAKGFLKDYTEAKKANFPPEDILIFFAQAH